MPDYSSLLQAVGTDTEYKNLQAQNANVNFDNRIAKAALPITRMLKNDGSIDRKEIKNANDNRFDDPYDMWQDLQASMPRGRGIDPVVFQEKYQSSKAMYDMNLANQVAQMGQSGYSQKRIWKEFGNAPDLRKYMVENGILEPRLKYEGSFLGTAAKVAATAGVIGGGSALKGLSKVPSPTGDQISALKEAGYKYQKGGKNPGIKRMTATDVYKEAGDVTKGIDKPVKKDYKYKSGKNKGKQSPVAYNKAMKAYNEKIAKAKKSGMADARKAVNAVKGRETSQMGKQALRQGSKSVPGKVATNVALKSVGKTLGTQVGKGLGMRALGLMGGVPGLAFAGAWTIYDIMKYLSRQKADDASSARWK